MVYNIFKTFSMVDGIMRIAIITNTTKDIDCTAALRTAEAISGRAEIFMPDDRILPENLKINYMPRSMIWEHADIAFIIGGDGTLLGAAPHCAKHNILTVGVNLGKVGFLTEVEPDDIQAAAERILSGSYTVENRMLIKTSINGAEPGFHALNDIVVSKTDGEQLIGMELYTDGELVNHYAADGLIIATPTGSTGYSISAGGPVVDPRMELYVATPICAHMLSARSAVLPAGRSLTIRLSPDYPQNNAIITADGERKAVISERDEVSLTRSQYEFKLIRIGTSSFYNTLVNKLS